jgi:hypothetical protein
MRTFRLAYAPALAVALMTAPMLTAPLDRASAQIGVAFNITVAPPPLPVYVQPPLPEIGYLWTPGYWDYGEDGYFWVPGTWVAPPEPGLLWTPGYWGWNNGVYVFNRGYWGPHVGFYGGIDYGFGYTGFGFFGGEWRGGVFAYNSAVVSFGGLHVTNVYNRAVIHNTVINHVSFNGPNGITARPTPQEAAFAHERHVDPTPMQMQHRQAAAGNPALRASVNHGAPAVAATARPGDFHSGVVPAHGAAASPAARGAAAGAAAHPAAASAMRPGGEPHTAAAPHAGAQHSAMAPHGSTAPHGSMAPHASGAPHGTAASYHPAGGSRPTGMQHQAMAPHPAPAPHPAAAPHGGGGGGHEGRHH